MVRWQRTDAKKLRQIDRAALAHDRFAAIHPFIDGNGRTARLIMNLLLLSDGYPPTVILRANRKQYYGVLAQADRGNAKPLVNFVGRATERSLNLYLEAVARKTKKSTRNDEWIPLREAADGAPYARSIPACLHAWDVLRRPRSDECGTQPAAQSKTIKNL